MTAAEHVIRWSTAGAVVGIAAIAAVASYEHAYTLVRAHGEAGWTGRTILGSGVGKAEGPDDSGAGMSDARPDQNFGVRLSTCCQPDASRK